MLPTDDRTIAAISTARGEGGIAIVRVSGPEAEAVLRGMFAPAGGLSAPFESHRMMYGRAVDADGSTLDEVMAVLMRAPRTYTREDVAEIHCHGGGVSAGAVLSRALALGARMAGPGEFTRRAFMNGRIDLSEAEAVMQLIGATGRAAARASLRQLSGGVSGFVRRVADGLTDVLALLEASTDFPEEIDEEAAAGDVLGRISALKGEIDARCDARAARLLREGASIVLAGRPNVGKSSLMNALLDQERAIVTDIPGTTRDVLTERISIGGVLAEISDTAGLRSTDDPIERIGVDRARRAADGADVVLAVIDASEPLEPSDAELLRSLDENAVVCLNKTDLAAAVTAGEVRKYTQAKVLEMSVYDGHGIDALMEELARRVAVGGELDGVLTAQRHIELARRASETLALAMASVREGMPLDTAAIDIREALEILSEITGENATEAVIDRVFSSFCVGK